ncbi:hypothetical protein [Nocardia rosealba]|uniref:hypothetical protein n=1 Tax=Nocardia rosealba TaxID=2878563 RepID=UPI001CDA17B2|nr:hypothetical protein [Nocardia rosealba]MCA2208393.1 hypothetical protein [Nocardia rosealba]
MTAPAHFPRTVGLGEAIRLAQCIACEGEQLVGPEELFLAVVVGAEPGTRCRSVLHRLGIDRAFTEQDHLELVALSTRFGSRSGDVGLTDAAQAVLDRLPYWAARTGDRSADTSHLLLACLEQPEMSTVVGQFGATTNDILRTALAVRRSVAPADRPVESAGPILSARRHDRPSTHVFDAVESRDEPFRTYTSMMSRSQLAGAGQMSSPIQRHVIRLHMLVMIAELVASVVLLGATVYGAVTATPLALIWLGCLVRRDQFPLVFRLAVDLGVVTLAVVLGIPTWPVLLVAAYRLCDVFEERLGLIQVRGAVADPALTLRALRSDRRINYRGVNNRITHRLTRRSTSDALET